MKTGPLSRILSFSRSSLAPPGAAAGPGGAPAAAQRRGRRTWRCEGPAAGSPAAGNTGSRAYRADGDRPGGWRAGLISLSPPRGEDQVGWEGFAPVAHLREGPSTRPQWAVWRLPERRACG